MTLYGWALCSYGHQVVCHQVDGYSAASSANAVDGDPVPVPHFGLAMTQDAFHELADRVRNSGIEFIIEPHLRFVGMPGEQVYQFPSIDTRLIVPQLDALQSNHFGYASVTSGVTWQGQVVDM